YMALIYLLPASGLGADIGGAIRLGVSQTDNVFLSTSPDEVDDVVMQASPSLSIVHKSPNLDANLEYTFDWYRYSDSKTTSKYHHGEVTLTGRAFEDNLTVDVGAQRSQVLGDPEDVIPPGSSPLSGNLVDEDELWFNPRFRQAIGGAVTLVASYRYSKIQFDQPLTQENTNQSGNFGLENYRAGQGLTWALRYDWNRSEYDISVPWENRRATAELGFWVNAKTRMFGAGGKESSWDNPFDPALDDPFWEAGFAYSPSDNLSAEFAAGERSFGSSWRGRLDFTFRRGSTLLSYDESPTTTGFDRSGGRWNLVDADIVDDFLNRPGSAERYISKRLNWDLNLEFRRTKFIISVFDENRSDRISADGTLIDDQSQTGVTVNFSWQAGVRTEFAAFGSRVDQDTGAGNSSEFAIAGLNISYRLGTRSNLSLGYSYSEQQPSGDNPSGQDYVANVVSLFFTYSM
ncbi:MAG: TIGR03016 family PEP-CTERM system-associated outer membrane protein, partial [Gammaproteobacteria bacterium]|nr:TIGR03016 family PEP-CTERM system-associated outer membrane protein [Gammaproteobacteria bacterium]